MPIATKRERELDGAHSTTSSSTVCMCNMEYTGSRRPQWPRGLRRRSAAARLMRLWVRIAPGTWMSVCCECCVLSGRGLCEELITRPEESYRLRCVVVCDLETSRMRTPWPTRGAVAPKKVKKSPLIVRMTLNMSAHLAQIMRIVLSF